MPVRPPFARRPRWGWRWRQDCPSPGTRRPRPWPCARRRPCCWPSWPAAPSPSREEALAQAETLGRAGWAWAPAVIAALRSAAHGTALARRGPGCLEPDPRVGGPGAAGRAGLAADRSGGRRDAAGRAAGRGRSGRGPAHPGGLRRRGRPRLPAARAGGRADDDAGRGRHGGRQDPGLSRAGLAVGRGQWPGRCGSPPTPAPCSARSSGRAASIYPDPAVRARKAVVRKGRENYLCLLNFQEAANAAQLGAGDLIGLVLTARWIRATRDGDMTGGDFPAWLPTLFAVAPAAQAERRQPGGSARGVRPRRLRALPGLLHRKGDPRLASRADIVIANHALVLTQAAFDGARAARGGKSDGETTRPAPDRLRRGPPPVRRRRQRLRRGAVRRRGGGDAPLDPRARGARTPGAGSGGPSHARSWGDREESRQALLEAVRAAAGAARRGLVGPDRAGGRRGQSHGPDRDLPGGGPGAAARPGRALGPWHGVRGPTGAGPGARDRPGGRRGHGRRGGAAAGAGAASGRRAGRGGRRPSIPPSAPGSRAPCGASTGGRG